MIRGKKRTILGLFAAALLPAASVLWQATASADSEDSPWEARRKVLRAMPTDAAVLINATWREMPASEPRAVVRVSLDLEATQDCEEAFDLAVYRDRSIDLVQWDDNADACSGRVASIRYLSSRTDEKRVLQLLRPLALRVAVLPGKRRQVR